MENNMIAYTIENKQGNEELVINIIESLTNLSKLDKDKTYLVGVDILKQDTLNNINMDLNQY